MAPHRIVDPTGFCHLTSRGNFGRSLYEEEVHRQMFLRLYERVASDYRWTTLAYCLMTNHFHLVVQLNDDGLSRGMQQLNGGFSRRMNAIYGRTGTGHLFKNRFHNRPIEDDSHLLEACRYITLNPVAARICDHPEQWMWSSYRACAGLEFAPKFLAVDEVLALFGSKPAAARQAYVAFVADGHARLSDQRDCLACEQPFGPG